MAITLVGFDADDTLWHSESFFVETERRFADLMAQWYAPEITAARLLARERANLEVFGYGVKGFTLSMIETAMELSDNTVPHEAILEMVAWGKEMMTHAVDLLPSAKNVVAEVSAGYRTVLITKGDLFHQESKVAASGLVHYFDRVEILTEKSPDHYRRVLERCGGVSPQEFVMIGNSLRSDVLPVTEIGGFGVHVPYEHLWGHEKVDDPLEVDRWLQASDLAQVPKVLADLERTRS